MVKLLALMLLTGTVTLAQNKPVLFSPRNTTVYSLVFISGLASGVNESLYAYNPWCGDHNWDPYLSWKNQYRDGLQLNGKTFKGKYLAFTTDGNHFTGFVRDMSMSVSVAISWDDLKGLGSREKKWYLIKKLGLCWAARTVGHNGAMAVLRNR